MTAWNLPDRNIDDEVDFYLKEQTNKAIRQYVHGMPRWFFASSRDNGPAHIVKINETLCNTSYDTRARVEAKNLCGNCRRVVLARYPVDKHPAT